jgi:Protein of unknown function (DUF3500)
MGLAERQLFEHFVGGCGIRDIQDEHHALAVMAAETVETFRPRSLSDAPIRTMSAREAEKFEGHKLEAVYFAWAGGIERGQPHYYRLQAPRLLAEYDNTQRDVNHIHTVWRDPTGDFADDILARHHADFHSRPRLV